MPPRSWRACGAIVVLGLAGCARTDATQPAAAPASPAPHASAAPDETGALLLPDLMADLVDPAAGVLLAAADGEGRAEQAVRTPEAWAAVIEAGQQLTATGDMLARPALAMGRSDWSGWATALRDGADAGIDAARRQDGPALIAAAARLRAACQACRALYAPPVARPTALLGPR